MTTSTLRPPAVKQTPTGQPPDLSGLVSAEAGLDANRLAASCASVPGLAPVVETLKQIHASAESVPCSKDRCRKLSANVIVLVSIICDHYYDERAEMHELQIEQTVQALHEIHIDFQNLAGLSLWESWDRQRELYIRIDKHEEHLKHLADFLSRAATPQIHEKVAAIQKSLKNKPATSHRPPRRQTSVFQLFDIPLVVSAETVFDVARLTTCCALVPGLAPVVETLRMIYTSVERLSWNKGRCHKLSSKAMTLIFIICDYYDQERADTTTLQIAVERTVQATHEIDIDVRGWAALSFWKSWYTRHDVDLRIDEHEERLKGLTEFLTFTPTLQIHDKVAGLQESLKNNSRGSADRKRAEEQLYRLRSARLAEPADLTPPELACECVRLGSQPEYSGIRTDIWKGRWLDKQDVALIFYKEYRLGVRDDSGTRRFDRQIKIWRKLDSPFVLRLYGWCKFDGETYLVSPWLRNHDVVRYLDGDRGRHRKCISLVYEIAQGLRYLHTQGIIHGSLKPSNILVQDDGRACLSDFSLAKLATPDAKNTQTNPQVNALRYQAPEVILDEPISKASDIYSWAMTALEVITGDPPFHTWKSPGQLVAQVMMKNQIPNRDDYKSPVLDKHPEIWEMFVRCWSRESEHRPTAKEIVDVLEKIPNLE